MKAFLLHIALATTGLAATVPTLIFEDDFNRNESQEITEDIGPEWTTNSKSRASGHKQVDLREGAMHIFCHPEADHAVAVRHPAEFRNGSVEFRFMMENEDDRFNLDFADPQCKEVHSGHLFAVRVSTKEIMLLDLKTGRMKLETNELIMANKLTEAQAEALKAKEKKVGHWLQPGIWHSMVVTIKGESLVATVDGKEVVSFASEGIAHPTKRVLGFAVPKRVVVDDLKIFKTD